MKPCDGTQQWHHVHCTLQWHPGATSNAPKWFVALPPIGSKNPYSYRYLGKKTSAARKQILQNFLTPGTLPKKKLYQHRPQIAKTNFCAINVEKKSSPTIAHYNGTLQWHPAMAPRPLPQSWSSPSPPTIEHYNGTQQWHHVHCTRPIRQSGSSPSPLIGSKNPYSYRYLGKNSNYNSLLAIQVGCHKSFYLDTYQSMASINVTHVASAAFDFGGSREVLALEAGMGVTHQLWRTSMVFKEPKKKDEKLAIMKS